MTCSIEAFRAPTPLKAKLFPAPAKPLGKLIAADVAWIVYPPFDTELAEKPGARAIARMVSVEATWMGVLYTGELVVGVVPSIV
jgi:hypothetical protein